MLSDRNYKSMLLEYVQAQKLPSPRYVTVNEEGPNHARTFSVEVLAATPHKAAVQANPRKKPNRRLRCRRW
jgi:dsRNA-specific ribonuclease